MIDELGKHFVLNVTEDEINNDPIEVLNWYRNLYYKEDSNTERAIMAKSINNLFQKYKISILC